MHRTILLFSLLLACDGSAPQEVCPAPAPVEIFKADPAAPPMPPPEFMAKRPRKAGDGPSMAVVSDGSELGEMFGGCGFEGGDPLYTSYDEWLGEGDWKYIILETRVYTPSKNDTCVREWFEQAGAYPINGVGSSESGSDSSG